MQRRLDEWPDAMRFRRSLVDHVFGTIKDWMGRNHFKMRTLKNVATEASLHILAYNIKRTSTVLRLSYARVLETPFNENLIVASVGCDSSVLNPLLGCASSSSTPLSPGWRNEFHAGLQQACREISGVLR